ncbi:MAG TPA: bifunctional diaminohydroxyphosphoribosylaminopyrimidine deaminase/5-amino-6-(5-phosphoribosylamino)uracil reductase RibD [Synergistales bacterium]|nr:bifunctional diaminohydroxyphosphoribosylaminopyrimidine deaminase/5-amino-6-(5-phosphoribosylamino)uracil reductase RibD [Synergistaceae bacterium]HPA59149.1 bifunctional diaminohydroxyphosphoribosylaminopyrimidine deaminase/5-amino-6-(5-phosphoribosylamino)uracil reductase RibD [Synergistales bacterium]HQO82385.1 bifunctional diaminohydroxyphosphoribosylaminopyrimidine deaminase/5-amino-6-(5-phosphoribosylamino)uracil reductase RibD [Synergistales bacterium]HQQ10998.1 bifunctional diaminohy
MRTNDPKEDAYYMGAALSLALRGTGRVSPNPMVGCVIVGPEEIVGWGYHEGPGKPHAEAVALDRAGEKALGATLYVNLEPCCHQGRTPPCAPRIIEAGIARVVAGLADPDPRVSCRGFRVLKEAGIKVDEGLLQERCKEINRGFLSRIERGRPWVTLKGAVTLDGNMAMGSGESRWITNAFSRVRAHMLRDSNDAVMVGVGTVMSDDPELTVRDTTGRDPVTVVLDPSLRTPLWARVVRRGTIIFFSRSVSKEKLEQLEERGCTLFRVSADMEGRPQLEQVLQRLAEEGFNSVLVEGGPNILGSFMTQGLFDSVALFISTRFSGKGQGIGGGLAIERLADSIGIRTERVRNLEGDLWLEGVNPCSQVW